MIATAGQTDIPNGLTFFEGTHTGTMDFFLSKLFKKFDYFKTSTGNGGHFSLLPIVRNKV